jgi:hypothetical protein
MGFFGYGGVESQGLTYIDDTFINFGYNQNNSLAGYINYHGYQGGTTQFRDLVIGNGKTGTIARFQGPSGNVGIGTVNPTSRLEVKGSGATFATSGLNVTNSDGTSVLFVRDNGSVGIGTAAPQQTLEVNGYLSINAGYPSNFLVGGNTVGDYTAIEATNSNLLSINKGIWTNVSINGNVGIGTTSPNAKLEVKQTANSAYMLKISSNDGSAMMVVQNNGNVGIGPTNPDAILEVGNPFIGNSFHSFTCGGYAGLFENTYSAYGGFAKLLWVKSINQNSENYHFYIEGNNNPELVVQGNGNVGIGTSNPGYLLAMESSGGGYYSATDHQWHNASSRAIKTDIEPNKMNISEILDEVNIVNYRYKTEVTENENAPYHIGFIADDTPSLLSGKDKNSMATADCIGLLLATVKEQKQQIESLNKQNELLQTEVENIKKMIGK